MKVRIAFIGTGGIAQAHMERLSRIPDVEFVGMCDIDEEKARGTSVTYGGRVYTDYHKMLEELEVETEKDETKKLARNPRHLGSRTLREFVRYYKPDVHIFAHVHKQGGKVLTKNGTMFCNVSHLSSLPYRLTGRKFLFLRLTKEEVTFFFDSVVIKNLSFQDFHLCQQLCLTHWQAVLKQLLMWQPVNRTALQTLSLAMQNLLPQPLFQIIMFQGIRSQIFSQNRESGILLWI